MGNLYLFCVDVNIDVVNICKQFDCNILGIHEFKIDESKYNNNYQINRSFLKSTLKFKLVKYNDNGDDSDDSDSCSDCDSD